MTLVKICGITNLEDAQAATQFGADLLGFIFHLPSPRYVTPKQVRDIVTQLSQGSQKPIPWLVGVFVDEKADTVSQTLEFCGLDYAQLHGSEPPEMVTELSEQGYSVIKGFRMRDGTTLAELARYPATAYLLDSFVPGQPGGTGHTFDWTLAAMSAAYGPVIVAGGLTPDNVTQAIHTAQPWGVDVSSGVEAAPGRKDLNLLYHFIHAVKGN
jgi:phosphoribosylanthranilate isomerase